MASGETNLEFRVKVGGLNELGQLRASVLKLKAGTIEVKDASMMLANAFPKLEGTAKDLQKIFFGQATTMKMLVRNNKVFRNEIRSQVGGLKAARKETTLGSAAWRTYSKQIVIARKQMSGLPLRKLGTDLRNVTNLMLKKSKDLQWVGRQMIVGITAPLGIMLRSSLQAFEAFEKQFVRTTKILGLTGKDADDLRGRMHDLSTELGVSRSIVAGLTSDYAQMGKKMLGGGDDLAHTASMYAELTLKLEHVGQVSAQVGRDFVANIAGIIGDTHRATGEVDAFGKEIMELVPKIDTVRGILAKFNLVENMTALSLKDLAEAFPQVSPAAKAAGIDLVFLSGVIGGMRQSGLNATESAHALKFALQRMVNPTSKVVQLSEQLGAALGSEFHKDLGIGNMMLFKLAENMQLIKEHGSDEEALVYLGELVGKRQASRIYATTLALRSFGENVDEVGQIFSRIGQVDIGNRIAGTVDDTELRAQFASIFEGGIEAIDAFLLDVHKVDVEMKKIVTAEGLENTGMLNASQEAQALALSLENTAKSQLSATERSYALNTALKDLSPPMKAMVIDFMGATSAGQQFVTEFEAVMGGPAMMMQTVRGDIRNLLLDIGTVFFDTIKDIIPKIREWIQAMQNTSPAVKKLILGIGLLAAALGPIAFIFGQAAVGISSIGRVAAGVLPKMKDLTRSLLLSKAMAGENLPALRRFGSGWVQVGGRVKSAGKSIKDTFKAIRSDQSVMQSGFQDFQNASRNVLSGGGAAGAAGVIPADAMHGPAMPAPLADSTKKYKQSYKAQEKALRDSRRASQNILKNSADDVDRWGRKVKGRYKNTTKGVKDQSSKIASFIKGFKKTTVQQQVPSRGITNLTGLPAKGTGGQFMKGVQKRPSVDAMKKVMMKPLMGITKAVGKVGEKAIAAGAAMKKGFMHPLKTIKAGMFATFRGSFRMIRAQSILSATVFKLAWKASLKAVKIAMMTTGIMAIMIILGAAIMYIVQNLGVFKKAAGNAFATLKVAWNNIVQVFKEIGQIFFDIFEDIFGKKSKEGGQAVEDSMSGVASVLQGVANVALWFSRIFRKVFLTILPPIIRGVLTVVKWVADGIGVILRWLADNWRTIAKVVIEVVYWIVKILEYLVDTVLIIVVGIVKAIQFLAKPFFWIVNEVIIPVFQIWFSIMDKLLEVVIFVVREVVKAFLWLGDKLEGVMNSIIDGIDKLGGWLNTITGGLIGWDIEFRLGGEMERLRSGADDFFETVQAGRESINEWVQGDSLENAGKAIASGLDSGLQSVSNLLTDIVGVDMAPAVRDALTGVVEGADFAGQLTDAHIQGAEDAADEVADVYADATAAAASEMAAALEEELRKVQSTWVSKVKTKFQKEMKKIADSAMKAFQAYGQVYLAAYDTRIAAVNETIKAEKELTKTVEYETARREMISRMALDKENFLRNRALAIYEGRIEDARNISVKFSMSSKKSEQGVTKLDDNRSQHLLSMKRKALIDEIQEAKKHASDLIAIQKEILDEELALLQEKLPQSAEEWQTYVDTINEKLKTGMAAAFGPNAAAANSVAEFAQIVDDELRGKFGDMFDDAGVIDEKVTNVGPIVQRQVDGWLETFETFHTNAAGEMTRMFDEVEKAWIDDLNWEIIAFGWAEGRDLLLSTILPLVTELDLLKNGAIDAVDAMADGVEASVDRINTAVSSVDPSPLGFGGGNTGDPGQRGGTGPLWTDNLRGRRDFTNLDTGAGIGSSAGWGTGGAGRIPGGFGSGLQSTGIGSGFLGSGIGAPTPDFTNTPEMTMGYNVFPSIPSLISDPYGDTPHYGSRPGWEGFSDVKDWLFGSKYKFNGGLINAQYGKYLDGFQSSMVPVMAHGGEYVMNARAVQNIGLSKLESMNHTKNYQGGGGSGTNIFVENFIGEPEWFEGMMGEYNVNVAPKNERSRGLESRKISSMADNNRRGRV